MAESMSSIVVTEFGGPDVYTQQRVERPTPDPGQALVEVAAAGVNYLDVVQRNGGTPVKPPFAAGVEGVGTIVAVEGENHGFSAGQRVGWFTGGQGSFSDFAIVDTSKLVGIPVNVDDHTAVAALMQGITAQYLTTDTFPVEPGDVVLMHAAAGGVGQMLTQIAKLKGATVIGTTSTTEKAEIARQAGADHVLSYEGFAQGVKDLTNGSGASVVYDGVGATTFDESLNALRTRGTLVVIGNASGPIPPVDVNRLNTGGSLFLTRPTIADHVKTPHELAGRALDVFKGIEDGQLNVSIGGVYEIDNVAQAFHALESRRTTGKIILQR
ncbi:quinone oxidoreductase family protein [Brevibacterium moorei]|jgi:NADPH2:quinone reductase|uniref:quinone oxidoreductase family protein n=1 Tax=Brevibacterium moorei TaxID=2968457 RepID=UPI00211C9CF4|nr:quinone oxidoreductase [Brevibacterium sp. 68QC2CO]MCQ9386424.1 quinone oxidoreductase [Brevibacterium sp. 68QC2CO]